MRTAIRCAFVTVVALVASYGDKATAAGGRRPNVVILLADDKYVPVTRVFKKRRKIGELPVVSTKCRLMWIAENVGQFTGINYIRLHEVGRMAIQLPAFADGHFDRR